MSTAIVSPVPAIPAYVAEFLAAALAMPADEWYYEDLAEHFVRLNVSPLPADPNGIGMAMGASLRATFGSNRAGGKRKPAVTLERLLPALQRAYAVATAIPLSQQERDDSLRKSPWNGNAHRLLADAYRVAVAVRDAADNASKLAKTPNGEKIVTAKSGK